MKINVLGNYSGRNAGDAAILGCLLEDIDMLYPDLEFLIPTINPSFVRDEYKDYSVKPIGLLPWNLSFKIFGLPVFSSAFKSDLVLVTDAILFDRKLYNPLFNYLWTLSLVLPRVKARGIPVVLYNCALGPITTQQGKRCLAKVLDSADRVILRDKESNEILEKQGLDHPNISEGADCALNAQPADDERFNTICKQENLFAHDRPIIGFNVNSYVDAFVSQNNETFGRVKFTQLFANTVDRVIDELNVDIIFVETQHMDMGIAQEVIDKIRNKSHIRMVSNKKWNYRDICSVLKQLDLFVGMRTHSLILSSAMGVVPVGIVTYPKNRGYMRTIGLENNLIEFKDLSEQRFFETIINGWSDRKQLGEMMNQKIKTAKYKARKSAEYLKDYIKS
jgi:polysaccharide pyruvyl transferase WcaK-like protein